MIPTYETIGWRAPVLLFLLRIVVGFSTRRRVCRRPPRHGGVRPDRKRGFWAAS
ncbi:MFS transporter [Pseudonocardia sp. MCCB 268]|nr:MFS transporter [Pseudonocardia cytotoxica]